MPSRFSIDIDDAALRAGLARMAQRSGALQPALRQIGELLVASTKARFQTGTAPDGQRWAPNSRATIERGFARRSTGRKGYLDKGGRVTKRGAGFIAGKRPLIGESKSLSRQIYPRAGANWVEIRSGVDYAAVQQFGARKGQFGRTRRGSPIPWGNIPARPFLGISATDRVAITDTLAEHLVGFIRPK